MPLKQSQCSFDLVTMAVSSFPGRSSSASSFDASLLQAIDGAMSLALCPQVVSQAHRRFRSSETQAACEGCFARQSICWVISFSPACPGQYIHWSFRRWMSSIDTCASLGFPIHITHFCCKLYGYLGMTDGWHVV